MFRLRIWSYYIDTSQNFRLSKLSSNFRFMSLEKQQFKKENGLFQLVYLKIGKEIQMTISKNVLNSIGAVIKSIE